MECKLKHLEFIQGIIARLAANSFRIKAFAVALPSAVLILLAREGALELSVVGLIPIVVFWGLDGWFLRQERLFRALYDHVRALGENEIDFSMDTSRFSVALLRTVFSRTLVPFYLGLGATVAAAWYVVA